MVVSKLYQVQPYNPLHTLNGHMWPSAHENAVGVCLLIPHVQLQQQTSYFI